MFQRWFPAMSKSLHLQCRPLGSYHVPQRLQSVCVLLWRFPKLEVPFAISESVSMFVVSGAVGVRRTHFGWGLEKVTSVIGAGF
jgi:hypothetical protein